MTAQDATVALSFGISLLLLLGLLALFGKYRVDSLRDELFALRDEMFLYAQEHGLVEAPAYRQLRLLMNSLLRYSHRVSFMRLVLLVIAVQVTKIGYPPEYEQWVASLKPLTAEQAKIFRSYHERAMVLLAKHIIKGSPLLWVLFAALATCAVIVHPTRKIKAAIREHIRERMPLDLIEADALRAAM